MQGFNAHDINTRPLNSAVRLSTELVLKM